jgi:RNA 2',3'-cyclic 3'-phosphodiesterase
MCSAPDEPTRRLFFALWPDEDTRAAIAALARERIRTQARRVAADNLHITLAFPGNVTAGVQACLEEAAGRLTGAPFELAIDRLGYWPGPRIIWAAPAQTPPELWSLATSLREVLAACGLVPEKRPYQAHITLARKASTAMNVTRIAPVHWSIRQFCLLESISEPSGVRYRVRCIWPLEG